MIASEHFKCLKLIFWIINIRKIGCVSRHIDHVSRHVFMSWDTNMCLKTHAFRQRNVLRQKLCLKTTCLKTWLCLETCQYVSRHEIMKSWRQIAIFDFKTHVLRHIPQDISLCLKTCQDLIDNNIMGVLRHVSWDMLWYLWDIQMSWD